MPKSSLYEIGKKGQWFLISAIIITGSLVSISVLFKNYFVADTSEIAKMNADYLMLNLENQVKKVVNTGYDQPDCTALKQSMDDFLAFSGKELARRGFLVSTTYNVDCAAKTTTVNIIIISDQISVRKTVTI